MSLAVRVANRFSLTILNTITATIALGAAYVAHKYPGIVSPIPDVFALNEEEDKSIRSRFERLGLRLDPSKITIYKAPVKREELASIGVIGSLNHGHLYVPEPYLLPSTALYRQAYPGLLESSDFNFAFYNQPLSSSNHNEAFQTARKQFLELEPVFPESYDEMDMSLKLAIVKLKANSELEIIKSGFTWIATFTLVHQVAAWAIRPLNYFPLLPCAFGIGGMVYKGWKLSEDAIGILGDTPEHAATLTHHLASEIAYNLERKKFLSAPHKWFISSSGNDWFKDLLGGPTTRKHKIAQNTLVSQIYLTKQEDTEVQEEIGKHFKPKDQEEKDIL